MGEFEPFDRAMYDELTARCCVHKLTLYWTWTKKRIPVGSFADVLVNKKV
jgi:hypothetical protein